MPNPAREPDSLPTRRRPAARRLFVRRAIVVALLCALTVLVGTGLGLLARRLVPPERLGLGWAGTTPVGVLLVGQDPTPLATDEIDRPSAHVADWLHLVRLDPLTRRGFVLSIPSQTRALLGAAGTGSLGSALALGDLPFVAESAALATGLPVAHHVGFDMAAMRALAHDAGGVEAYFPAPVSYRDPATGLSLTARAGLQALSPEETLAYAWQRPEGDELARIERQQALLHEWHTRLHAPWTWWWVPGGAARQAVETDLPRHALDNMLRTWRRVRPEDVAYAVLPGTVSADGHWVVSQARLEALLERLQAPSAEGAIAPLAATVEIRYREGDDARVMQLADRLTREGFQVIRTERQPVDPTATRLIDRARAQDRSRTAVRALLGAVGGGRWIVAPDDASGYGARYTLSLGAAYFR